MSSEIKYFPVNWVDGMKVSKSHFVSLQNSIDDMIRDSVAVAHNSLNFGLLPSAKISSAVELITDHGGNLQITLSYCMAITPDGCRIQITENEPVKLVKSSSEILKQYHLATSDEAQFYLILTANPFSRIPHGDPLESELPPRNPFSKTTYKLDLIQVNDINLDQFESSSLILGKVLFQRGEFLWMKEFLPASTSIRSHPNYISLYNSVNEALILTQRSCLQIINKIRTRDQKSSLSSSIFMLAEKTGNDISWLMPAFKTQLPFISPVNLFTAMLHVPYSLSTTLSILTSKEKEELLTYLGEWAYLSAGVLENKTQEAVSSCTYNHHDPLPGFTMLVDYLKIVSELFSILSQLEFIGKRKGQSVFIVEHEVEKENTEKTRPKWSPLS